jgi:hypothetical protein
MTTQISLRRGERNIEVYMKIAKKFEKFERWMVNSGIGHRRTQNTCDENSSATAHDSLHGKGVHWGNFPENCPGRRQI